MERFLSVPVQVLLEPGIEDPGLAPLPESATVRHQSVQTMYRESEAQTDPYAPDFYVDPDKEKPEVTFPPEPSCSSPLPLSYYIHHSPPPL